MDRDDCSEPEYKLQHLIECKNAVETEYARECKTRGVDPGAKPLSGDDFMPVFCYLVAHSELSGLNGTISYLRDTTDGFGETGYYLTVLEAALTDIMACDLKQERLAHSRDQMDQLQKALEKTGFLRGGKISNQVFAGGQQMREATKKRLSRRP